VQRKTRRRRGGLRLGSGALVASDGAAVEPAEDGAADGEEGGGDQQKPGDQAHEGRLRGIEQDDGSNGSADEAGKRHGHEQPGVLADVFAVGGDGGDLAGPEGDGVGGVGLDGLDSGAEQGGEGEEGAAAGDGIEHSGEECRDDQPQGSPVDKRMGGGKKHVWLF